MEELRKELRITRIISGILIILLVCVLAGGIYAGVQIKEYAENTIPLVEKVSEVDFEVLNETLDSLDTTLNEIDWAKLSDQIAELDMSALNEAIAGLDTEALSVALQKLNQTIEALENFNDSVKSFFRK